MARLTVFDADGVFIGEYAERPTLLPRGYYVREQFDGYAMWFRLITVNRATPVIKDQLPGLIKMTCLALNLTV